MSRVIDAIIRLTDNFSSPMGNTIKKMSEASREGERMRKSIDKAGQSISKVGASLTAAISLPVAGVAVACGKMALDFEDGIAKVSTIADAGVMSLEKIKAGTLDLSSNLGVAVTEISEAQYSAISAGASTADSLGVVSTAIKAAKAGFTDTATAVDGLTTVYNSYQGAVDYGAISDQMMMTQNYGKTTFGELASSMGQVTPVANAMNVSTTDLFSSIAVLTKNGINTSSAVTGLKAAYSNVLKPTSDAQKEAKKLGLEFNAAHMKSVGWAQFMEEIKEKTGGNTESMAKLFGSVEALNSMTVLAGAGFDDFNNCLDQMTSSTGLTQQAYEKMLTPSERWNISLNKIKVAGIKVGEKLLPVFEKITGVVDKVAGRFNGLTDSQIEMAMKVAGVAAAIGPLVVVFGKLVSGAAKVNGMFAKVKGAGNALKYAFAAVTSPAGIVIGVLAAVALAAVLIIKNWDKVKSFLASVGDWFQKAFGNVGVSVQGFMDKFSSIGNTIGEIVGKITGFCKNVAGTLKNVLGGGIKKGVQVAGGALQSFAGGAGAVFDNILTAADRGLKTFSALIDFFGRAFRGDLSGAATGFSASLKNIFPPDIADGLVKIFNKTLITALSAIDKIKSGFKSLVQAIQPIIDSVKTILNGVSQFVKGVFTGDWKGALNGLKTIASGALSGVTNIIKTAFTAVKNMVKGAINAFKNLNVVKTIFTGIGNAIKRVLTKCGVDMTKFSANINNIKTRVSNIVNNLKTIFSIAFGAIGKFVRTAAGAVANVFGKKVSSTCSAAKNAITAFKTVAGAAFLAVAGVIKTVMAVIVPAVKVAFSGIAGGISAAVSSITSIISGLMTVFDGITTFIAGVFTGNWSQAWEGVKTIFSGVFESLVALCKTPINAVIGIVNGAISGINNLGLTIPDWVPLLGGKSFSINIPTIPMLYRGTQNWGGGIAQINERGGEIVDLPHGTRVYPHDESIRKARSEAGRNITIAKLADQIIVREDADIDRIAEAMVRKLRKAEMNMGGVY